MTVSVPAQPIVVVRFGQTCGAGVARAALRGRWPILQGEDAGLLRAVLASGARVLIVQLDEAGGAALGLVQRLAGHWNPVFSVVVGPRSGLDHETHARSCGAAAYVGSETGCEVIENLAKQLAASRRGTPVATGNSDGVYASLASGVTRAARA
jgi:hypothetical protein